MAITHTQHPFLLTHRWSWCSPHIRLFCVWKTFFFFKKIFLKIIIFSVGPLLDRNSVCSLTGRLHLQTNPNSRLFSTAAGLKIRPDYGSQTAHQAEQEKPHRLTVDSDWESKCCIRLSLPKTIWDSESMSAKQTLNVRRCSKVFTIKVRLQWVLQCEADVFWSCKGWEAERSELSIAPILLGDGAFQNSARIIRGSKFDLKLWRLRCKALNHFRSPKFEFQISVWRCLDLETWVLEEIFQQLPKSFSRFFLDYKNWSSSQTISKHRTHLSKLFSLIFDRPSRGHHMIILWRSYLMSHMTACPGVWNRAPEL